MSVYVVTGDKSAMTAAVKSGALVPFTQEQNTARAALDLNRWLGAAAVDIAYAVAFEEVSIHACELCGAEQYCTFPGTVHATIHLV